MTQINNPSITGLSTINPADIAKPEQMKRRVHACRAEARVVVGHGRRGLAVARVRIRPNAGGNGEVKVQVGGDKYKPVDQYFAEERDRNDAYAPLRVTSTLGKMDVIVRLSGGGFMGQAQALRLGIARALRDFDPSTEDALRNAGFLTRDAREVERKKYGQAGARRRFQFSKR